MALSTATFAWYSAGKTEVTATTVNVTAQAPGNAELKIATEEVYKASDFSWYENGVYSIALSAEDNTGLDPTVWVSAQLPSKTALPNLVSYTSTGYNDAEVYTNVDGANASPQVYNEMFYITNTAATGEISITANATAETNGANTLFYAIYLADDSGTTPTLIGTNATYIATPTDGANVVAGTQIVQVTAQENVAYAANDMTATVAAGEEYQVLVYAWIDGTTYDTADYNAGNIDWDLSISITKAA